MTQLSYVDSHKVRHKGKKIRELSGLCTDECGQVWVVSDRENAFFQLDSQYRVAREFPVDLIDLEGVAAGAGLIGVASEPGVFATFSADTGEATGEHWDLPEWIIGDPKKRGWRGLLASGLVGGGVTEKPGRMLSLWSGEVKLVANMKDINGFPAGDDCSGLLWDTARELYWICSHEGATLYLYDSARGWIVEALPLVLPAKLNKKKTKKKIRQAEGIAIDCWSPAISAPPFMSSE